MTKRQNKIAQSNLRSASINNKQRASSVVSQKKPDKPTTTSTTATPTQPKFHGSFVNAAAIAGARKPAVRKSTISTGGGGGGVKQDTRKLYQNTLDAI